ncbi:MAG: GAF domain-containing protein [Chthonomonadaceae bacterium]|nr:GAF domain-containing protein [Chthonomonadaceae bacterium]
MKSPEPVGLSSLFELSTLQKEGMEVWLDVTLERCATWFRASGATLFLKDRDGEVRLKSKTGHQSKVPLGTAIVKGEGIAGTVLGTGEPRIIGDPHSDPMLKVAAVRDEIASSMVIPIIGMAGEEFGIINLSRSAGEESFCAVDLDQAAQVAATIAMAVSNAILFDLTQSTMITLDRKAEELKAVLSCVAGSVYVFSSNGCFEKGGPDSGPVLDEATRAIETLLVTRESHDFKVTDPKSDKTWLVHVAPLVSGGGVLTVQDITSIQKSQDETARLRRLAEIGQMSAAIAHELRNPLTGIKGSAELLRQDPALAADFASIILDESLRMERLCNEFLEISKPLKLSLKPGKLSKTVQRVIDLWGPEYAAKGVELRADLGTESVNTSFDEAKVEQIAHNLLRNSLEATEAGGEVVVETSEGRFSVQDTGLGMDSETKQRLFSPFFTTKSNGTGLGLCNVRRIIDAHGGRVDVRSETGQGTRIEINLRDNAA